jgi:hypothetical protein
MPTSPSHHCVMGPSLSPQWAERAHDSAGLPWPPTSAPASGDLRGKDGADPGDGEREIERRQLGFAAHREQRIAQQ